MDVAHFRRHNFHRARFAAFMIINPDCTEEWEQLVDDIIRGTDVAIKEQRENGRKIDGFSKRTPKGLFSRIPREIVYSGLRAAFPGCEVNPTEDFVHIVWD